MNCPICNVALQLSERQGIEIDYCPKCRGIWLDRGELDKIIERSEQQTPVRANPAPVENRRSYDREDYKHHDHDHHYGHHKRKSFLHDLFD
ncbi:MAG: zf-TFIIB domain-containing protein [Smithella sp.]